MLRTIDLKDKRQRRRMEKAIDRAILDGNGEREWEDVCDVMDRALKYYDDPTFEPEVVQ